MSGLNQAQSLFPLENAQCSCFDLGEIRQGWFLTGQKSEDNKKKCEKMNNLYANFRTGEDKTGTKLSLKGNRSEKQMPLTSYYQLSPSMQIFQKAKDPVQASKTKKQQLIYHSKCSIYPVHKNQRHQNLNQKSTAIFKNTFVPSNEGLQRFSKNKRRNQPVFQQLQPRNIGNQYFLSSQRQQLKSPRFLSPKIYRKVQKVHTNLIDSNKRANKISPKIYSLKKIEEKDSIKYSLYPNNQLKAISNVLGRQEIKLVNQANSDQTKVKNAEKQTAKSQFSKLKRYTSDQKNQKARQATENIIARRKKQFSKAEAKIIKQSFSDGFKLTRNKLLRIDDMEEICSLADEDERTNSQDESIVLARLNDYVCLNDLKTQDALTSYSKLFSPNQRNSPLETSNKRSFFFHYNAQLVSNDHSYVL